MGTKTGWAALWGSIIGSAVSGLRQDIMGKEAWLRSVEASWMSPQWSVPLNIILLAIGSVMLLIAVRNESREASK